MRYGLAVLVVAFLAIVGTVVLIGRGNSATSTPARITKLADYDDKSSSSVSWTQQGKLVGEDLRKSVRVTVTLANRNVEILDGYSQRVEKSATFPNSPEAYASFMLALDNLNFGKERTVKQADERGVCPLGNRFIYRLTDLGNEIMRTWSDTCLKADGPFGGGTASTIATLFKDQITDYDKFVAGTRL